MTRGSALQLVRPASEIPHCDLPNTVSICPGHTVDAAIRNAVLGEVRWIVFDRENNIERFIGYIRDGYRDWAKWARKDKMHVHIDCQHDAVRIQALSRPYRKLAHWRELAPGQTMQLRLTADPEDLEKAISRAHYLRYKDSLNFAPFVAGEGLYLTRLPAASGLPHADCNWSPPP